MKLRNLNILAGIVLLFLATLLIINNTAFAAGPPGVSIQPSSTLVPFQSFSVNVTQCDAGDQVWIGLLEDGAFTSFEGKTVQRNADGSAIAEFDGLREIRSYTVRVNCDGEEFDYQSKITVEEFTGTIRLSYTQTDPGNATLIVEGCPPGSEVLIDWVFLGGGSLPQDFGQLNDTSDQNGRSESSFPDPGTYQVDAACGGANGEPYQFEVTEDGSRSNDFPVLPSPPEPPCSLRVDGKCTEVDTAIGKIRTEGQSIIYSVLVLILSLSGGILLLSIMYAGYLLIISRGNPEQIQKAREMLIAAIAGFLFIVFSYVILGVITTDILRLPGFGYNVMPLV